MFFYIFYTVFLLIIYKICDFIIQISGFGICVEDTVNINFKYILLAITIISIIMPLFDLIFKKILNIKKYLIIYILSMLILFVAEVGLSMKYISFNSELWKSFPNQRRIMYYNLKEDNILSGLSSYEVKNILGKPDDEIELYGENSKIMVYFTNKSKMYIYIYINSDQYQKMEIIN